MKYHFSMNYRSLEEKRKKQGLGFPEVKGQRGRNKERERQR